MKTVNVKVKRFDPESGESRYQDFPVEIGDNDAVLDALIQIREYQDETLAVRCSCRSAICGSCAMRVNGGAKLACVTKVKDVTDADDSITVEPMGNMSKRPIS